MKKLVLFSFLTAFVIPLTIFAQGNIGIQTVSSAETQKNLASDDAFLKALQTGDVSALDNAVAPDFVNHGVGEKVGIDSLKASIKLFYTRFKPAKVNVIRRLNDGEYFSDWVKYTGAKPIMVIEGIEMTRYANGKAVEHWFFIGGQSSRPRPR